MIHVLFGHSEITPDNRVLFPCRTQRLHICPALINSWFRYREEMVQ